jgi:hypothetical protein
MMRTKLRLLQLFKRSVWAGFIAGIMLVVACSGYVHASGIEVSAPKVVGVGDQFEVSFILSGNPQKFEAPSFTGFAIIGGPSTASSQNVSIINGHMTQSVTYSYSYYLQAQKEGRFTISPAVAVVNGKTVESPSFTIEVTRGSGSSRQQQNTRQQQSSRDVSDNVKVDGNDIFIRVLVDKSSVYLGQQVTASVKIYSRLDIVGAEGEKYPSFNGFFRKDVENRPLNHLDRETVNGKTYGTGVLRRMVLYPQKTGELVIDPVELQLVVQKVIHSRRSRSIWDDFFDMGPSVENVRTIVKSLPVKIKVKALPDPQPETFKGAVGSFSFKSSVDKTKLKANEAVTLHVTLSGTGNISLAEAPKIQFPADFEVYDPKVSEDVKNTSEGSSGSKTWEYVIIPRNAGHFTIPAVEYTSFNPANGKYAKLNGQSFDLDVAKGDGSSTVVSSQGDVTVVGKDIRYIKLGRGHLHAEGSSFLGSWLFWFIVAVCLAVIGFGLRRWHQNMILSGNVRMLRQKRASRKVEARLKRARDLMTGNNRAVFFEEIHNAMWGYLGDKLSISPAQLSRETAFEILKSKEVENETLDKLTQLLDACEMERFASVSAFAGLEEVYASACELITIFDAKLKK